MPKKTTRRRACAGARPVSAGRGATWGTGLDTRKRTTRLRRLGILCRTRDHTRPQVIPGYDLRPCHCARVGHIGRSVYLP